MTASNPDNLRQIDQSIENMYNLARIELFRPLDSFARDHNGIVATDFKHVCTGFDVTRRNMGAIPGVLPADVAKDLEVARQALRGVKATITIREARGVCGCERRETVIQYTAHVAIEWKDRVLVREYGFGNR